MNVWFFFARPHIKIVTSNSCITPFYKSFLEEQILKNIQMFLKLNSCKIVINL